MANIFEKHIKSILPEPQREDFNELLHRACHTDRKLSDATEKKSKSSGKTKRACQHKGVNTTKN